ncbi:hypothetical protein FOPE_10937 [Fonsecaea pedrosoi]|nr:hypothetical protein FOPE_10937 [Fonsecaea pedrosoi]
MFLLFARCRTPNGERTAFIHAQPSQDSAIDLRCLRGKSPTTRLGIRGVDVEAERRRIKVTFTSVHLFGMLVE